ncbi:ParB/RepB/Spo0J family partition protein [Gammaproteobacteria bacterium]|nr:ParB/RepB/Spo0J family partition protein [Gammaproteobacteria bacterium]
MANPKRRLGRALTDMGLQELLSDIKQQDQMQIQTIALDAITANANQPRKTFHRESIDELAHSIKEHGIIQPLVVKQIQPNQYQIIAGERRFRAATQLKLEKIPAIVKIADELEDESIALIENIQREDLNIIDQAEAFARLVENHNMSHEKLALKISKSRSAVSNTLRLNGLHPEVKQMTRDQILDMGHARAILSLPLADQPPVAHQVANQGLSVRQTEALITRKSQPKVTKEKQTWSDERFTQLLIPAKIQGSPSKGKVILPYKTPQELDRILAYISESEAAEV